MSSKTVGLGHQPLLLALLIGLAVGVLALVRHFSNVAFPTSRHDVEAGLAFLAVSATSARIYRVRHADRDSAKPLAPLIAIVGCDGSGKSTLAADMLKELNVAHHAEVCYLGLHSGDISNRIKQFPILGPSVERALARKADQTRTKGARIPGLPTALVVYGFSMIRRRRFRQTLALRRAGVIVVTDRYPQTEVAGFYDGPGLSAARAGNWLVRFLATRERRMYEWMASYRPTLVIRLNVDVETAYARKPDHRLASLRDKVAVTPLLTFNHAAIFDLDSRAPYADVRNRAIATALRTVDEPLALAA